MISVVSSAKKEDLPQNIPGKQTAKHEGINLHEAHITLYKLKGDIQSTEITQEFECRPLLSDVNAPTRNNGSAQPPIVVLISSLVLLM